METFLVTLRSERGALARHQPSFYLDNLVEDGSFPMCPGRISRVRVSSGRMGHQGETYSDWNRHEVVPFVPLSCRSILDVGCALGGFGALLKKVRPEVTVTGIEPNEERARRAAERLDHVVVGSFPKDLAASAKFECIIFNDVLEHSSDPWLMLDQARSFLSDGRSYVVASIPNVRHYTVVLPLLCRGEWTYASAGILDQTHLRFFTKKTMRELFESQSYVVESITPINRASEGFVANALRLMPHITEEFRSTQYVIVARL